MSWGFPFVPGVVEFFPTFHGDWTGQITLELGGIMPTFLLFGPKRKMEKGSFTGGNNGKRRDIVGEVQDVSRKKGLANNGYNTMACQVSNVSCPELMD
jgi:hypothetical protein